MAVNKKAMLKLSEGPEMGPMILGMQFAATFPEISAEIVEKINSEMPAPERKLVEATLEIVAMALTKE